MKKDFTFNKFSILVGGQSFSWNWTAAQGHFGGTLIGVRQGDLNAEEMGEGRFYSSIRIRNSDDDFCCEVINVYGPVKYDLKA
jgi:hypothetical protein